MRFSLGLIYYYNTLYSCQYLSLIYYALFNHQSHDRTRQVHRFILIDSLRDRHKIYYIILKNKEFY